MAFRGLYGSADDTATHNAAAAPVYHNPHLKRVRGLTEFVQKTSAPPRAQVVPRPASERKQEPAPESESPTAAEAGHAPAAGTTTAAVSASDAKAPAAGSAQEQDQDSEGPARKKRRIGGGDHKAEYAIIVSRLGKPERLQLLSAALAPFLCDRIHDAVVYEALDNSFCVYIRTTKPVNVNEFDSALLCIQRGAQLIVTEVQFLSDAKMISVRFVPAEIGVSRNDVKLLDVFERTPSACSEPVRLLNGKAAPALTRAATVLASLDDSSAALAGAAPATGAGSSPAGAAGAGSVQTFRAAASSFGLGADAGTMTPVVFPGPATLLSVGQMPMETADGVLVPKDCEAFFSLVLQATRARAQTTNASDAMLLYNVGLRVMGLRGVFPKGMELEVRWNKADGWYEMVVDMGGTYSIQELRSFAATYGLHVAKTQLHVSSGQIVIAVTPYLKPLVFQIGQRPAFV